ncbi:O-antigen ligase family protein [Desulfogranum japonicum]|uniref:O-antigen ligase family protein n=1 Tax=Desulfogranum japonicum TaxID=231447 RepID=UPI0003F75795|nr:O-antigen ligase family protein [Desulfogranum japonicum]
MFYCVLGIIEGRSRGAFLSLVVLGFTAFLMLPIKKRMLSLSLFAVLFMIFSIRYVPSDYIYRMQEITNPTTDATGSAVTRLNTMKIAAKYIVSHPFSEFGLGNHSYLIAEKYGLYDNFEILDIFRGSYLTHSIFLQYGADTGFVPMSIYILFVISIFHKCYNNFKNEKRDLSLSSCVSVCNTVVIIALFSFFSGAFFLPWAYRIFMFILLGSSMAVDNVMQSKL